MENTSKMRPLAKRDVHYYRQRQKNRVFAELCAFFEEEAKGRQINKKMIAEKLMCDPALITRWLSAPSNLTLDTISDLLLALDAEMDYRIMRFSHRPIPNAEHPVSVRCRQEIRPSDKAQVISVGNSLSAGTIKTIEQLEFA